MNVVRLRKRLAEALLAVPVRVKIAGIMLLPVLVLGISLNFWVRAGLSDWLSWLLDSQRVAIAMQAGSRSVMLVTGLAAVASLLFTYVLMLVLTQPLLELQRVAGEVAGGNLDARARAFAQDEIGDVAAALNNMLDELVRVQRELSSTNQQLQALNQVAVAVGRGIELEQVLTASLRTTIEVMQLPGGWIYLRDPDRDQFRLANSHQLPAEIEQGLDRLAAEPCDCQHALLDGRMPTGAVVRKCSRLAAEEPPAEHISIPLQARGLNLGVLNLLVGENGRSDQVNLQLLSTLGTQVSEAVANAWLHAALREKETARLALLDALVRAQEEERARLARELHDGAGQVLTSLLVRLKSLDRELGSGEQHQALERVSETVVKIIDQIGELSHRLRPAALEELGLEAALEALAQDMSRDSGLQLEFESDFNERRLPADLEITLYRIAQEALTNVIRHANATTVQVELVTLPHAVGIRVQDNGQGFDPEDLASQAEGRRLGLIGIQERAEMQGGTLVVYTAPGQGTTVEVRLPLVEADA